MNVTRTSRRNFLKIAGLSAAVAATWAAGSYTHQALQGSGLVEVSETRLLMGTVVNLTLVGDSRQAAETAVLATLDRMSELEAILSRHRPDSQLSLLNGKGKLDGADAALLDVLTIAQQINRLSDGAFDVTVKPLVDLYQHHHQAGQLPSASAVEETAALVGYHDLHVDGERVTLAKPGMGVTLDGIGKGYIVDAGVETLRSLGFANVLIEAGGDLAAMGEDVTHQPWRIGVQAPRVSQDGLLTKFKLIDQAAATSGDYMQPFSADLRHHHILDPRTGYSSPELASVTVLAPSAALADGWATALSVVGVERARELLTQQPNLAAYLVAKNGRIVEV